MDTTELTYDYKKICTIFHMIYCKNMGGYYLHILSEEYNYSYAYMLGACMMNCRFHDVNKQFEFNIIYGSAMVDKIESIPETRYFKGLL